jgi:RHS repeat-associated protein
MGMLRGPPRSATANGTYTNTPASGIGTASNQASSTGFGAVNGYTGALDDAATDLTHLGARDLDPVLGIFTAPDPLMTTAPRHSSPYTYASGDPVNLQDTTGLRADSAGGGGGGGSGVGGRPIKYGSKDGWAGKPARYKTTPVRSSGRGDSLRMGGAIRGAIRHTVHYQHEPTPQFGYAVPPSSPGSWSGFSAGNWSGTSYGGWTGNYGYAPVANGYGGYSVGGSGSAWYGAPTPLPGQAAPLAAARPTYESSAAQYAKSQQATADLGNSALSSVSSIQQNYRNGKAAEQSVMNMHPGSSGASFPTTPAFGRRFIDVLTEEGTAIEVKVGYTRLSKFVENQIAKDVYLRSQGEANLNDIQSVEWWFARSPRTSLIGPSPKLAEALRKANIEIKTF